MSQIDKKNQEFVKTNSHEYANADNHEFGYWKSLKDISSDQDYERYLKQSEHNVDNSISRRNFLSLIAASVALAGLEGCKKPVQKIIPYVEAEIGTIPGIPKYYASTLPFKNNALGVVIENHDERPVKVEGNDKHPTSLGKSNSFAQASTLDMYDPDRLRGLKFNGKKAQWSEYIEYAKSLKINDGRGLAILSQESSSPTINSMKKELMKKLPKASWVVYEPINNENLYDGIKKAFGRKLQPFFRLEHAQTILSIGSDFMGVDDNNIYHTRKFAQNRDLVDENSTMNRLYVAESSISSTGSSADHRLNVPNHKLREILLELAYELKVLGLKIDAKKFKSSNNLWVKAAAEDLMKHKGGESIILGGTQLSSDVHHLIASINYVLQAPIDYYPLDRSQISSTNQFAKLCSRMKKGEVEHLVILGANPVYDSPADFEFRKLIKNVPSTVHLTNIIDETSKMCQWNIALTHYFECWGDAMTYDGFASVVQPQIMPLFDSKSVIQVLSPIIYDEEKSSYDIVKSVWKSNIIKESNFDRKWEKVLHDGIYNKPLHQKQKIKSSKPNSKIIDKLEKLEDGKFEVVFSPSSSVYDGRFSNNGWLQEIPKPITSLTWDNAALISMKVAKKLNVKNGQYIEISLNGKTIKLPVWITPGQNNKTITLELGYGRDFKGRIGNGVGFNVYPIRFSDAECYALNATVISKTDTYPLASTQDHYGLEDDKYAAPGFKDLANDEVQSRIPDLVKQSTLDYYKENPDWVQKKVLEHKPDKKRSWEDHSMYNPDWDYSKGPQWGMSIDLTSCTSCNACSIACQSENNIPVVGKQQVMKGREMHWIRIDNYFAGDPENPEISTQSISCVHCELAPCETVCPVAATTHSSDGVNQMTYNRCLGTRYCANNCPYKVRKFNFYNYTRDLPEVVQMAMNPDVSVRFRGVMEKCTYCYQRVSAARIKAKNENREMRDGDVKVACASSCPADAIKFGDITDPNSEVSKAKRRNRDYALLAHLGTAPRTTYLAKIRNQNPKLISGKSSGGYQS